MTGLATRLAGLAWLTLSLAVTAAHAGQGSATASTYALQQDALCTKCHDEGEAKPLLSIYQTRHGVKADARTPTCQGCHGKSEQHIVGGPAVGEATRPGADLHGLPPG